MLGTRKLAIFLYYSSVTIRVCNSWYVVSFWTPGCSVDGSYVRIMCDWGHYNTIIRAIATRHFHPIVFNDMFICVANKIGAQHLLRVTMYVNDQGLLHFPWVWMVFLVVFREPHHSRSCSPSEDHQSVKTTPELRLGNCPLKLSETIRKVRQLCFQPCLVFNSLFTICLHWEK